MTYSNYLPTGWAIQPIFNDLLAVAVVNAGSGHTSPSCFTSLTVARKAPRSQANFLK